MRSWILTLISEKKNEVIHDKNNMLWNAKDVENIHDAYHSLLQDKANHDDSVYQCPFCTKKIHEMKYLTCYLDGNALGIVNSGFRELQASPVIFIVLSDLDKERIINMLKREK